MMMEIQTPMLVGKVIKPIEDKSPESVDGDDDEGDDSDDENSSNFIFFHLKCSLNKELYLR
jgi:hypothetical protein